MRINAPKPLHMRLNELCSVYLAPHQARGFSAMFLEKELYYQLSRDRDGNYELHLGIYYPNDTHVDLTVTTRIIDLVQIKRQFDGMFNWLVNTMIESSDVRDKDLKDPRHYILPGFEICAQ